jgi:hypothetical protein
MQRISEVELRKMIVGAEAKRLKTGLSLRLDGTRLRKSREASEKMMSQWLRDSGLDPEKLRALHEQRSAEWESLVARRKKEALRLAARQKKKLHAELAAQSKALRGVNKSSVFPHPTFSLDTPFLIWTSPLMTLSDSNTAPFDSWAKFKFTTSASQGTQKVSFYFYWVNPYSDYAVISAATFLSSTGHLKAHAPWSLWSNWSSVEAGARFGLWFGLPRDVDASAYVTEFQGAARALSAFLIGGDTYGKSIFAGSSLSKTMFAVPPRNVVVFEVALALDYENDDGDIEADFESGDFRIACPVVVFSLLNAPGDPPT